MCRLYIHIYAPLYTSESILSASIKLVFCIVPLLRYLFSFSFDSSVIMENFCRATGNYMAVYYSK